MEKLRNLSMWWSDDFIPKSNVRFIEWDRYSLCIDVEPGLVEVSGVIVVAEDVVADVLSVVPVVKRQPSDMKNVLIIHHLDIVYKSQTTEKKKTVCNVSVRNAPHQYSLVITVVG